MLGGGFLVLIDVQFGNSQLAFVSLCNFVQNWSDHFARAAPFSPVIDQYSAFSLEYVGLEASVANVFDKIAAHGSLQVVSKKTWPIIAALPSFRKVQLIESRYGGA
jgi:hypothetical protein